MKLDNISSDRVPNAIATEIANGAVTIFMTPDLKRVMKQQPRLDPASGDGPARVTIRIGGKTPEHLQIVVHSQREIKFELSQRLADLLDLHRTWVVPSLEKALQRLANIASVIRNKLRTR